MIHIPVRLRVSNKVIVCFPLQSLYAFLFWLLLRQQVLERRMSTEAKEEAWREESGEVRGEDLDSLPPTPAASQNIYVPILKLTIPPGNPRISGPPRPMSLACLQLPPPSQLLEDTQVVVPVSSSHTQKLGTGPKDREKPSIWHGLFHIGLCPSRLWIWNFLALDEI